MKILIIDDYPLLAAALGEILEREGHRTLVTVSGQDGLDGFRMARDAGAPFDLVLTDFSIADVDGLMVAAGVKRMSAATPVVMITAYKLDAPGGELPPNVDAVLNKPPSIDEMRALLARFTKS